MEEDFKILDDFKDFLKEEFSNADIYIEAIYNLLKRYKELEEENKHRLSQVNFLSKEYDIMFDTINNLDFYIDDLIKECKEGIERLDGDDCDTEIRFETEIETLQRIKNKLSNNDFKYKVSIPVSVIQNKIDKLNRKITIFKRDIRYCQDRAEIRLRNDEIYVTSRCRDVLQELLEERRK